MSQVNKNKINFNWEMLLGAVPWIIHEIQKPIICLKRLKRESKILDY